MTSTADRDLLEGYESTPSVSFDPGNGGAAQGEWVKLTVLDYIEEVQAKDDDGKPLVYEDTGKPVMKAVLRVQTADGEERALWMKIIRKHEGALFRELVEAQKSLKEKTGDRSARLGPGTKLAIRWSWNTAVPKKLGNHPKKFEVRAAPGPAPAPKEDPFADTTPSAPAASDPWAEPMPAVPVTTPESKPSLDPFGGSDVGEDEPPF